MSILDRFSLRDRVALVTGGAGPQFGSSISEGLAQAGATVISASRSLERNEEFVQELRNKGFDAHAMQVDITDLKSIHVLRDRVNNEFGRLDVLVNNAVVRPGGSFADQTPEDWEFSARGNMTGLLAICQNFLIGMVKRGKGSVINIASIYGVIANDPSLYEDLPLKPPADYNFVKAGMVNFTRYLANFYGRKGIRVNCISPGGYHSDDLPEPFVRDYNRRCPLGRMLERDDIKGAVVFLASDASAYITGANLMVDGGWTAL